MEKTLAEIDSLDADHLLASTVDAVVDHFEDACEVEPLVLHQDRCEVSHHEEDVDVSGDPRRAILDRSRPTYIKGTRYVVNVPFSGDPALFSCRPSTFALSPPDGEVARSELRLSTLATRQGGGDQLQAELDRQLSEVSRMVANIASDVARFNSELRGVLRQRVEHRRAKVLADKKLVEGLRFPIRRSPGAVLPVPVQRKKIRPLARPSTVGGFRPEPAVSMEDYEEILRCVRAMATVMERSPSSFAHMQEEQIRDQFLVPLNNQFEGAAAGETFNFTGKADILIRVDGKNVFIAECKFWRGEKSFLEALDQLLGYACWRDTKLALLVFNRNKDLSAVIEKIRASLKGHPNFLREGVAGHETSMRCTVHHRDDRARELTLTVVVFEIPA